MLAAGQPDPSYSPQSNLEVLRDEIMFTFEFGIFTNFIKKINIEKIYEFYTQMFEIFFKTLVVETYEYKVTRIEQVEYYM